MVKDEKPNRNTINESKQLKKKEADAKITEFCKKKKKSSNILVERDHKKRTNNLNPFNTSLSQTVEFPSEKALNNSMNQSKITRYGFRRGISDDYCSIASASENNLKTDNNLGNIIHSS